MNAPGTIRHRAADHRWDLTTLASIGDAVKEFDREFKWAHQSDYAMAKQGRFNRRPTGVNYQGTNADYHLRSDLDMMTLIEMGRQLDRDDPIVGQALTRLVGTVLQDGIAIDPQTGDKVVDEELKGRWKAWSRNRDQCDDAGELTFQAMARLAMRQTLVDGDVVMLPLRSGRIQMVEAHRLRTPRDIRNADRIVHGIELNPVSRRRERYWLSKVDLDPTVSVDRSGFTSHPVRDDRGIRILFHLYTSTRISATRGHTIFAPVQYMISSLDELNYAKLIQAKVSSMFGFISQTPLTSLSPDDAATKFGSEREETLPDGSTRMVQELETGLTYQTKPGEDIKPWHSNIPEAGYFNHASLLMSIIAINLGLPLHALLMDPTKTNFSGWRGSMALAQKGFRRLQQWMIDAFYAPVWEWKVTQWMATDPDIRKAASILDLDGRSIFTCGFQKPSWESIEPWKDAQANQLRMESGLTSPRRLHAENGQDFEEITTERVADYGFAIDAAMTRAVETKARFPDHDVDWREFLGQKPKLLPVGFDRRGSTRRAPGPGGAEARDAIPAPAERAVAEGVSA